MEKDMKHIPTKPKSKSKGTVKRASRLCWEYWVTCIMDGVHCLQSPRPPCRVHCLWISRSWKPHLPISLTPGLQSRYTWWISPRTWAHTLAASAISAGKSGCWSISVGPIIKSQCSSPEVGLEPREPLVSQFWNGVLGVIPGSSAWTCFPRLFQWLRKYHKPCVRFPSYTGVCSWTCLRQSAGPLGWPSGVHKGGSGRYSWKRKSGAVVRNLAYQVKEVRPQSVMGKNQGFLYKTEEDKNCRHNGKVNWKVRQIL